MKHNIYDGWGNVVKGIGTKKDITTNTHYSSGILNTYLKDELNHLYVTNGLAGKVVNIPVDDALRDGIEYAHEDNNKLELFKNRLSELSIDKKINSLAKWSKIFGSACIVVVSDDDEMREPLFLKKGDLKNIVVIDAMDIFPYDINLNPLSSRYLSPKYYRLNKNGANIHHTRVIQLDGIETTNETKRKLMGFGVSVYEQIFNDIRNATMSPQLLSNLLVQSNQDVYKIKGFNDSLSLGDDQLIIKRIEAIQQGKSLFNGISLDSEDGYENISKNFSGLNELNQEFYKVVAGLSDIPYTRLMGTSATGLNATGEGDQKNYNYKLQSEQTRISHVLKKIYELIEIDLFGEIINIKFDFPDLFQMNQKEKAEVRKIEAETDQIYLSNAVLNEIEVRESLIEDNRYQSITSELIESEKMEAKELNEEE